MSREQQSHFFHSALPKSILSSSVCLIIRQHILKKRTGPLSVTTNVIYDRYRVQRKHVVDIVMVILRQQNYLIRYRKQVMVWANLSMFT